MIVYDELFIIVSPSHLSFIFKLLRQFIFISFIYLNHKLFCVTDLWLTFSHSQIIILYWVYIDAEDGVGKKYSSN